MHLEQLLGIKWKLEGKGPSRRGWGAHDRRAQAGRPPCHRRCGAVHQGPTAPRHGGGPPPMLPAASFCGRGNARSRQMDAGMCLSWRTHRGSQRQWDGCSALKVRCVSWGQMQGKAPSQGSTHMGGGLVVHSKWAWMKRQKEARPPLPVSSSRGGAAVWGAAAGRWGPAGGFD